MLHTDRNRPDYAWLGQDSKLFLQRGYLKAGVTAVERIKEIAAYAEKLLKIEGYAAKFEHYMARGYFSLSSPIWANFGLSRGMPISCFGSYVPDSIEGIMTAAAEIGMMSKIGGGTSAYFGDVRPRGSVIRDNGKSNGSFNFLPIYNTLIDVISQGTARRGQCAGYIDIEHGDIEEWFGIQTEGNPIQLMPYGVCVGHDWLESMKYGDMRKRELWAKLLSCRSEFGIPYVFFKDNANNGKPDVYKDLNMPILASNLCSEIMLPSNEHESFVCCLSSINLLYIDEIMETDAVKVLTQLLDAVLTDFIEKAKHIKYMERAVRFAERHRALGLGVLGWHSYLQSKMIAFESFEAMMLNTKIFKYLQQETLKASQEMAQLFGEPELLKGYGRRNTTLMSVAPTKSSSTILGEVSPSIEPLKANFYVKDLAKIKKPYKNPFLEKLLEEKGMNTPDIWEDILLHDGSVQHLEGLTEHEKSVFKTFAEISQMTIIQQAAARQQYIDQGQSINIMIHPSTPTQDINQLYLTAEEMGLKALYYQHNMNAAQVFNRNLLTCVSCEA